MPEGNLRNILRSMFRRDDLVNKALEIIHKVKEGKWSRHQCKRRGRSLEVYIYMRLRKAGIIKSYYNPETNSWVREVVYE